MDFEDISSPKDDNHLRLKSRNSNERYSTLSGGQVDLTDVEVLQHSYSNPADKPCQLYRQHKADQTLTAIKDNDRHTKSTSCGQLGIKIPSNVSYVTESSAKVHICCNTFENNDLNDETFMCGACKLYFRSVCELHGHLNSKHSPERYIFDFSVGTAFPEMDKVCRQTQTDLKDLIELDKEQLNVESDCFDDDIKIESNFDDIDNDKLNECYSDESDAAVKDPTYPSDSHITIERNKSKQKKWKRTRTNSTSRQLVNNSGAQFNDTSDKNDVVQTVLEATDVLSNHEDEKLDNSSCHTSVFCSDIPDDVATSKGKVDSKTSVRYKRKKSTAKKKSMSFRHLLNSVPNDKHGKDTVVNADEDESLGYKCDQCQTKYPSMSRLRCHIVKVHSKISDTTLRQCRWCRKTIQGTRSYLAHTRQCDKNENLICFICDRSFPTKSKVLDHLASHKNAQDYKCQFCQKSFVNELSLQHHLRRHNQRKNIQCEHCGKAFFYQYHLTRHLGYCNKDPTINCDQCELKFKTTNALNHHMTVHSNDKPYVCHICGYAVKRSSYLTRHIRSHTGERPYSCSDCGVNFTTLTGLNRHKKTHTNDKPYVCTYCEKSFTNNWNLKTHLRQHTGDTPYKCELCGKAFKQNVLLKLHWKSHHP